MPLQTINKAMEVEGCKSDIEINFELARRFDPDFHWNTIHELLDEIVGSEDFEGVIYDDRDSLLEDVERGVANMGVVIPADYDAQLNSGAVAAVEFVGRLDQSVVQYRSTIEAIVADQSAIFRAARFVESGGLATFDEALVSARQVAFSSPGTDIVRESTGESVFGEDLGQFDLGPAAAMSLIYFLMVLLTCWAFYTIMMRNEEQ